MTMDDLLNNLFGEIAKTNARQAGLIGFDKARLSRLRTGSLRLTEFVATQLAKNLVECNQLTGTGIGDKTGLCEQLMAAARETERAKEETQRKEAEAQRKEKNVASIQQAIDLFHDLSKKKALLCVEYRDLPVTIAGNKYSALAALAGEAVAKGLSFAMFQPFGNDPEAFKNCLPSEVRRYRADIIDKVREIHWEMIKAAEAAKEKLEATKELDDTQDQVDIKKKLVLYERGQGADPIGFQSRLFYVVIPEDNIRERREIWEWVSTADGQDIFVQRGNLEPAAVYQQFFEVTAYWHENRCLPSTDDELIEGARLAQTKFGWIKATKAPKPSWNVYFSSPPSAPKRGKRKKRKRK